MTASGYSKDVQNPRLDIRAGALFLALLGTGFGARAQSVLDQASPEVTPPPSTSFFPLDQVKRGLHGTAYTVFEGTKPEAMDVEIIGLLHGAIGPGQDMILARLHGAKPEFSGVVAGMSGSPVYIDGKLLGALSYRIGQFSKEPIAGITPIGEMLQVREGGGGDRLVASQSGESETKPVAAGAGSDAIRPIETPLVFSGFSAEAVSFWNDHAKSLGLTGVSGIGGSASESMKMAAVTPGSVLPGSAVSAQIVRGDMEIAATCTVTYVDPKQLLACGHPITQYGSISMPMTRAEVLATLPSPLNAFKIINTTSTIGSFTADRETAIRGEFGREAKMIPVALHLDREGTPTKTLHLEVIDQDQVTPMAVMVSVFQGLMEDNGYAVETTYRVRGTVKLAGYPDVKFENLAAPSDLAPSNLMAALTLGEHFNRLYANAARRARVEGIDIHVDVLPGRHTIAIESAQAELSDVHAGDTVTIEATVRPWRSDRKTVRVPVKLPATLPDGPVRLLVSDGSALDRLMQPPQIGGPTLDVAATIAQLNNEHTDDRLYVTLLAPETQASIEGRTLTALPLSMANVLEPLRDNRSLTLNGESAVPLGSVEMGAVLSGQQVVTLRVK